MTGKDITARFIDVPNLPVAKLDLCARCAVPFTYPETTVNHMHPACYKAARAERKAA